MTAMAHDKEGFDRPSTELLGATVCSIGLGLLVAQGERWLVASVVLLGVVLFVMSVRLRLVTCLVWWVALAPVVDGVDRGTPVGLVLNGGAFVIPPLAFLVAILLGWRERGVQWSVQDVLPAALLTIAALSLLWKAYPDETALPELVRQLYVSLGIGVIIYYVLAYGRLGPHIASRLLRTLVNVGTLIASFAIIEHFSGWNPWGDYGWHALEIPRAAGPFKNPAVLGTFLGTTIVIALAHLLFRGPHRSQWALLAHLGVAIPALCFTYVRASMVAVILVGGVMVAMRPRVRGPAVMAAGLALMLAAVQWTSITNSAVFHERVADESNIQARVLLGQWSLQLAERAPLTGSGWGSFDEVKAVAELSSDHIPASFGVDNTSHNTFLTVLVELGAPALILLIACWLGAAIGGARSVRKSGDLTKWPLIATLGVLAIYVVNASSIDMRFFAFVTVLPWLAVGLMRRGSWNDASR